MVSLPGGDEVPAPVRQAIAAVGLTGVARKLYGWALPDERDLSIDGTTARFGQSTFGDHVELNQVGPERPLVERLRREVRPDGVFLDIGSNLGVYAVFVGDRLQDGTVVAVEAVPATARKAAANLDRNGIDGTVANVAFSDARGTTTVHVPAAHGSANLAENENAGETPEVRRVTGDAYLDSEDLAPTVLKIDVEGHEEAVLAGLSSTLSAPACRLVYCEVHGGSPESGTHAVHDQLRSHGFAVERVVDLPGDRHVVRASNDGA